VISLAALPLQAESDESATVAEAGRAFALFMADGDFHQAAGMVGEYLAGPLSARNLVETWTGQSRDLGRFRAVVDSKPTLKGRTRYTDVECEWERGRRTLQVILDENLRVTGLLWMPLPTLSPEGAVAPPPAVDDSLRYIEGKVGREPWTMPGTLTLPKEGPVKAGALLIHDAGNEDRDATAGVNKPFRELAMGLARKGVAVLRYDKRTYFYETKLLSTATTIQDEVLDDALLALNGLRGRKELEGVPIYVVAHGFGGTLAPQIAALDGKVAGIVLLGGVARSIEEVIAGFIDYNASFVPEEAREERTAGSREKLNALRTRTLPPTDVILGVKASYWYDLADQDSDVAIGRALAFPGRILVIQGGRDFIATIEDFKLWQAGLSKHPQATFQLFDDLNHVMAKGRGKASSLENMVPKPLDTRVIDLIADWCTKSVPPPGGTAP
jgi:hypothetical protein